MVKKRLKLKTAIKKRKLMTDTLLEDLMNSVPDVIYFKDKNGKLVLVNRAHATGLKLSPQEVIGKSDFDIFPKDRARLMAKDDEYVIRTGKPIVDKIERYTRPDGIDNYVSTTKIPHYDKNGKIIGLIGITRDITARYHLEQANKEREKIKKKIQELKELNRLGGELISVVSHELRTPVSIVNEAISLVLEGVRGPLNREQKEILDNAKKNVERLRVMIEELLNISRIEKGKLRLRYSLVNLNDLILDSSLYFKKLAQAKNINLTYNLPKEKVNIFVDHQKIAEVITNLLDNAIKFTEQKGKVEVELKVFEDRVRIAVIDSGIGIASADQEKIFGKFIQIPSNRGLRNKGIGLGLAIVKELILMHGGQVWLESKPGVGSKFYFTLPLPYMSQIIDKEMISETNKFLEQGISLFLINLVIINYQEFKKLIDTSAKKVDDKFRKIINTAIKDFGLSKKMHLKIYMTEFLSGETNIIMPDTKEKVASAFCNFLKAKMNSYFKKNTAENVFVNIGILDFPSRPALSRLESLPANIHIKRLQIGAEKRRKKRFAYNMKIGFCTPELKKENAYTLDISEGGICFASNRKFETDAKIKIELKLPNMKKPLCVSGSIAWIKEVFDSARENVKKYKMGLSFIDIGKDEKKAITAFIKDISKSSRQV